MVIHDAREYTTPSPEDDSEERSTFQQAIAPCGPPSPPDGGVRAFLVMFASFINTGVVFGVITGNSLIIAAIQSNLASNNVSDASSKAGELSVDAQFHLYIYHLRSLSYRHSSYHV